MDEDERKKIIQNTFDAVARNYDNSALRFFSNSAHNLSGYLALRGDERLLDVATGTGHASIALASHLPDGTITGIDFSEEMLSSARAKLSSMRVSNVNLIKMDMQALEFPDAHFDAAVCAFGLFFVDDMARQLAHIANKVKPGGRILITSFNDGPFNPLTGMFFEHLKTFGVAIDPQSMKKLSSMDECRSLFESAGLAHVQVDEKNVGYYIEDASQWWDVVWNAGFRRFVNMIAPEEIENFKKEHLRQIQETATDKGIWLDVNVLYTSGARP